MTTIQQLFPNASASTVAANPHLVATDDGSGNKNPVQGNLVRSRAKRGRMNETEAEFALYLKCLQQEGQILRFEYEGITLRWNGVKYTPDFVVFCSPMSDLPTSIITPIKLIEVKGAFTGGKFERAIERFRHARTYWPEFAFEMHQKTKQGWKQIH